MRDEKEGRKKQANKIKQATIKAMQRSTPKAVTFLKKKELPQTYTYTLYTVHVHTMYTSDIYIHLVHCTYIHTPCTVYMYTVHTMYTPHGCALVQSAVTTLERRLRLLNTSEDSANLREEM